MKYYHNTAQPTYRLFSKIAMTNVLGSPLDLAKCTIAPRVVNVQPPSLFTQTAFPKKLDITGNFQVNDSLINVSPGKDAEQISTQSGLMAWFPCRGASSLYRMGIVRSGKSSPKQYLPSNIGGGELTITFGGQTPIPYSQSAAPLETVKISPDLSQQFSQVRLYSGDLRLICDTVPIGLTALNGYFSAGAFSDSRDVSLVDGGSASAAANQSTFSPSDLVQASVTSKDGLKEVNVMKGIVSVIGSDIPPFYKPPLTDETDEISSGWATYDCDRYVSYNTSPLKRVPLNNDPTNTVNVHGNEHMYLAVWVTPWTTTASNYVSNQVVTIQTDPINMCGVLDIDISASIKGNSTADVAINNSVMVPIVKQIRTLTFPVFVTCTAAPNYSCLYRIFTESSTHTVWPMNDGGDSAESSGWDPNAPAALFLGTQMHHVKHSSRPRMFQKGGMTDTGMYLGTLCYIVLANPSVYPSIDPGFGTSGATTPPNPAVSGVNPSSFLPHVEMRVRARSLYNMGEIGPMRVIRWDGLSDGQQIKLDGVFNAQCIPEGNLAPFVTDLAMYSDTAHNVNALVFLAELYNGDSPFKRNWTGDEYDMFMRTMFPKLSVETVLGWSQPKLKSIATNAFSATKFTQPTTAAAGSFGARAPFLVRAKSKSKHRGRSGSRKATRSGGQFGTRCAGQFGGTVHSINSATNKHSSRSRSRSHSKGRTAGCTTKKRKPSKSRSTSKRRSGSRHSAKSASPHKKRPKTTHQPKRKSKSRSSSRHSAKSASPRRKSKSPHRKAKTSVASRRTKK